MAHTYITKLGGSAYNIDWAVGGTGTNGQADVMLIQSLFNILYFDHEGNPGEGRSQPSFRAPVCSQLAFIACDCAAPILRVRRRVGVVQQLITDHFVCPPTRVAKRPEDPDQNSLRRRQTDGTDPNQLCRIPDI